jgi:hypothetical protein
VIRVSEMVLQGHPDKFCDQVADAIVAECVRVDPDAYAQIEVGVWSDEVWLSGGICTRKPLEAAIEEIVHRTGVAVGYTGGNWIDAARYKVTSTVCIQPGNPLDWSAKVNDQSVVVGWAGYNARTRFLPPEHFLAHSFREALAASCQDGLLAGHGPDGKLLPDALRLTSLGRFMRSLSLDELPELFNVLRGEMSLVGPRPLLMQYLERYTPEQMRRHDVLPGLTGWAQVNGRNAITWEDKFKMDVWYVDHWSFWLDIKILFLTLWKVFTREGISQPGHATAEEFRGNDRQKT